jgi:hypothetical protein
MRNSIPYELSVKLGDANIHPELEVQSGSEAAHAFAVDVIYTTDAGTRCALQKAWALAEHLGAQVRLIFLYAVPFSLPLTAPAVSLPFLKQKLAGLAGSFPGEASVRIYLCREPIRALRDLLPESSLVVLGGGKRWWPTRAQRLETRLKKLGHPVIFAETR